jgi:predicted translin family RNA/ssDNA-binding protein
MRTIRSNRMRPGFVEPGTLALVALLAVGAISLATTSGAMEQAVSFDAAATSATEVTAPEPAPLPVEPAPPPPATNEAPPPVNVPEKPMPPEFVPPPEDDREEPPPDPRECRDVRRQIRDQFRELNRFEKMLRKLKLDTDLQLLVDLRAKLKGFDQGIASGCTRERLQEFHDEQIWEEINKFRCKAELPQQHIQIERDLKRLERQSTPKRMQFTGLDQERYKANIAKVKQALADAKAAVASGSCEDANEAMQTFWEEGMHPGEIMGVVNRLYELGRQLARVKDPKVREVLGEVLAPVIDAANEGDFREANQAMNEVWHELQRILYKLINSSRRFREYQPRLEKLEELLRMKLGDGGAPEVEMPKEPSPFQ